MDSKYQQYYDALNGKEFNSYISKYSSTLNYVRTNLNSMESIMESSWSEKGSDYIKSSVIPALKTQETGIEQGVAILSSAVSKCNNLLSKLSELKSVCEIYNTCEEKDKEAYLTKKNNLEREIDSMIAEINGISIDIPSISTSIAQNRLNSRDTQNGYVIDKIINGI